VLLWPLGLSSLLWETLLGVALSSSDSVKIGSSSNEDVGACLQTKDETLFIPKLLNPST